MLMVVAGLILGSSRTRRLPPGKRSTVLINLLFFVVLGVANEVVMGDILAPMPLARVASLVCRNTVARLVLFSRCYKARIPYIVLCAYCAVFRRCPWWCRRHAGGSSLACAMTQTGDSLIQSISAWSASLRAAIGTVIVGKEAMIERLLVALLCEGHVLTGRCARDGQNDTGTRTGPHAPAASFGASSSPPICCLRT